MWRGILVEFRWLPPFLRLATLLGTLCILTSMVLCGWTLALFLPNVAAGGDFQRIHLLPMAMSLLVLGFAFNFLSSAYRSHVRSPDTRAFPFHSWQQQARITILLAALPLCAFVLALVVPVDPFVTMFISTLVSWVGLVIYIVAYAGAASWPVDNPPASTSSSEL